MQKSLNLLAFAYIFPPDASSGVHRTLHFTNHWARNNDVITLITVATEDFLPDAPTDPALCSQIERSIEILRTAAWRPLPALLRLRERLRKLTGRASPVGGGIRAGDTSKAHADSPGACLKDAVSTLLTFPDPHSGWIPHAVRSALRVARTRQIDCIYASGGPWSTFLAAAITHAVTRIPLVLDFRDPWASNPNLQSRSRLVRAAHRWLEARCIKRARTIVANTEELKSDFIERYPRIQSDRFITVPNGFEILPPSPKTARRERFTLVHAGALYLSRDPRPFLTALTMLLERGEIPANSILVRFLGGVETTDAEFDSLLAGLQHVVEFLPRQPHARAVEIQREADGLLLFQTGFPLQVPRKLYEYLSLRLPILAVTESGSATARILREIDCGRVVGNDAEEIAVALSQLHRDWRSGSTVQIDVARLSRYNNSLLAATLRSAIARALGRST
jgi:glycosyltransferase involved in cell wall biosynthesis